MKTPKWICNICKQTLTRKWNAKRHCNTKHDGISDSIIPFAEYSLMTTTTIRTYPKFSNPNVYPYNINQLPYQENSFFQNKSSSTTIPSIPPPFFLRPKQEEDMKVDEFTKREILLSNTLDKIAPKYEEIKNLLSYMPEPDKTQFLGNIISIACYADSPIRYINNQLKDLRKAKFYNRMLNDASVFLGFDKQSTKEYLKMGLKEDVMD
ncbi:MAG: hypothetical protein ACM3VV_04045 [Deltaproteobacteria bacterium]